MSDQLTPDNDTLEENETYQDLASPSGNDDD
jgi:hypothetical protein